MRLYTVMPFGEAAKLLMPVVFVIAAVMLVQEDAPPEQIVPVLMLLSVVALGGWCRTTVSGSRRMVELGGASAWLLSDGSSRDRPWRSDRWLVAW